MENHEFEQLVELAIIEDTSEHIPHQKHTFPSDFEVQLRKKAAQAGYQPVSHSVMTKKKLAENHTHHISKHRESVVPPIYAFGCLAACLLFSLGFGIMLHQNDHESLMQSTAIPLEVLESKPAVSTAISTESTAYAAERAKQKITTATTVKTDVVELTENSIYETVTSITEPLIMGQITDDIQITVTSQSIELPKVTTSTSVTSVSETTARSVETTETAPPAPVYALGDVDMDGKITYADAMLVRIDMQLAERGMSEKSFLNDEQRALGDVDGKDSGRYWDGVSYAPEWNGTLGEWGMQIKYEPYLLDTRDYLTIKCVVIAQMIMGKQITIQEYYDTYGQYYDVQSLLNQISNKNQEAYKKLQEANNIINKYNNIECIEYFSDDDMNGQGYSLEEFWADMEILRTGLV